MAITTQGLTRLGFDKYTDFVLQDDSDGNGVYIKEWLSDQPQPSEADITTAHNEWEAEYDSQEYARNRAKDYPPLEEQLDYIYHNGVEAWKADMILPVKTKHPKGGN